MASNTPGVPLPGEFFDISLHEDLSSVGPLLPQVAGASLPRYIDMDSESHDICDVYNCDFAVVTPPKHCDSPPSMPSSLGDAAPSNAPSTPLPSSQAVVWPSAAMTELLQCQAVFCSAVCDAIESGVKQSEAIKSGVNQSEAIKSEAI